MIPTELRHPYPIHVVGVGGIGSKLAEMMLRGDCGAVEEFHLWDGDGVERHNLHNQAYVKSGLGLSKVRELERLAEEWGDMHPYIHEEFVDGPRPMRGVVVLCLDTMSARRRIWETCIRRNPEVQLMIETRMDALAVHIYTADPNNENHIFEWEKYWYPDEEMVNEGAGCGLRPTPSTTVGMAASLVGWQLIRFASIAAGIKDTLDNRIRMRLRPLEVETFHW